MVSIHFRQVFFFFCLAQDTDLFLWRYIENYEAEQI